MLTVVAQRLIEWGDCDPAGIVYNPNIMSFFDHGATLLYKAAGWSKEDMVRQFGIIGCPVIKNSAEYKRPIRYDEWVEVITSVREVGRTSFSLNHEINHNGTICAVGNSKRVWAVVDELSRRIRSQEIPETVRQKFLSEKVLTIGFTSVTR